MSDAVGSALVLASSSVHRRQLLERLGLPFECAPPGVDEAPLAGESPAALATRLARAKALAVARERNDAIVIGSDQVALRGEQVLGKPGDAERCRAQLAASSGCELTFLTAVCVVAAGGAQTFEHIDRTIVQMRVLDHAEIARYVAQDRPWDCAGGFKAESLGVALVSRIETVDPTALTGLPLIWLAGVLRDCGLSVP
ncbi:MAG TPA: nucleoside triphosphate pyrophosphatase [Steroidobacteraceae bacterium]|nr:nucleoside triphosphate pyrophosphatase [Steroidobacteraceae bacterium]